MRKIFFKVLNKNVKMLEKLKNFCFLSFTKKRRKISDFSAPGHILIFLSSQNSFNLIKQNKVQSLDAHLR